MTAIIEAARFCAKLIATPVFIVSFGFCWLMFLLWFGTMFQLFAFLENERFDWKIFIAEINEFFCEPLTKMWGQQRSMRG